MDVDFIPFFARITTNTRLNPPPPVQFDLWTTADVWPTKVADRRGFTTPKHGPATSSLMERPIWPPSCSQWHVDRYGVPTVTIGAPNHRRRVGQLLSATTQTVRSRTQCIRSLSSHMLAALWPRTDGRTDRQAIIDSLAAHHS